MKRFVCALVLTFAAVNCSHDQTSAEAAKTPRTKAIIFVPGYYGSVLRETKTQRRVFITLREALFGREALSLYQQELQTPMGPELELDGILKTVPVIPGLYSIGVYGGILAELEKCKNVIVASLAYDWRMDLMAAVRALDTRVNQLKAEGITQIDIVAHSMGGLVTTYYLAYGTQEPELAVADWRGAKAVRKVVLLGSPLHGAFSIFRNAQRGADFSWNKYLLPAEAIASFPSTYELLPSEPSTMRDRLGQPFLLDLRSADLWRQSHLGLLRREDLDRDLKTKRAEFTARQLAHGAAFSRALTFKVSPVAPPTTLKILSVIGYGRKTVDSGFVAGDQVSREFVFDTDSSDISKLNRGLLFVEGDGTVTLASAKLPEPLAARAEILRSTFEHTMLFEDPAINRRLQAFLDD